MNSHSHGREEPDARLAPSAPERAKRTAAGGYSVGRDEATAGEVRGGDPRIVADDRHGVARGDGSTVGLMLGFR